MKHRRLGGWLGALVLSAATPALAHEREIGIGVTNGVVALPALGDNARAHDLAAALALGVAVEYSIIDDVAVRVSAAYGYALSPVSAGTQILQDHSGVYLVTQDTTTIMGGARFESRTWLLPFTGALVLDGGLCVVHQSQRTLSNGARLSYGLSLPPQTFAEPAASLTLSLARRIQDRFRIALEPTLQVLFARSVGVGVGVNVAVTFLRFL